MRRLMVSQLLNGIFKQLNQYIRSTNPNIGPTDDDPAIMGNMARTGIAGESDSILEEKIVISLVNIAEEASLKNKTSQRIQNGQHFSEQPAVHLNLYLLFAANYDSYPASVDQLFKVVEFFQGRRIFNLSNAPFSFDGEAQKEVLESIELIFDIHTLSFEQINDLWGSLGGKQVPFVLYRARLFPVQMQRPLGREGLITEIDFSSLQA